jgi:tetratricopeptide (TPR) repeat protein
VAPAASPAPLSRDHFAAGIQSLRLGRFPEAESALIGSLIDTTVPAAWRTWFLARARIGRGDTIGALEALDTLPANAIPRLKFDAALMAARLEAAETSPYRGIARLLSHSEDPSLGARARYHAGELLLEFADTAGAARIWRDLCSYHPSSPYSHKASLRLLEFPANAGEIDAYGILNIARSAALLEDFGTAHQALETLARKRIDRRLRDDVLLLHGDVLFRLSRYRDALVCYREAILVSTDPAQRSEAERGTALCRLYLGDSPSRTDALHAIRRRAIAEDLQDRLETLSALMRVRGDSQGAAEIRSVLARPSLEDFLEALRRVPRSVNGEDLWESPVVRAAWRSALERAEEIAHRSDRALAVALLAERGIGRADDLWRAVLAESPRDALLERARRAIERFSAGKDSRGYGREADALLGAALRALGDGEAAVAVSRLRTIRYGYPGSPAAAEAARLLERTNAAWLERTPPSTPEHDARVADARRLLEAGAAREAALELEGVGGIAAAQLRIRSLEMASQTSDAINEAESARGAATWPIHFDELPAWISRALFPLPDSPLFRAAADSEGVDPAFLAALARVRTRFDPVWHGGFQFGILALDAEAVGLAAQFPNAPRLRPEDLLLPDRSLALGAWMIRMLGEMLEDSSEARIAGLLAVGIGNAPEWEPGMSVLEWIAHLPFRSARDATLDVLDARDRYARHFARPSPSRALTPSRPAPASRAAPQTAPRPAAGATRNRS